jgi:hypothetical protein
VALGEIACSTTKYQQLTNDVEVAFVPLRLKTPAAEIASATRPNSTILLN